MKKSFRICKISFTLLLCLTLVMTSFDMTAYASETVERVEGAMGVTEGNAQDGMGNTEGAGTESPEEETEPETEQGSDSETEKESETEEESEPTAETESEPEQESNPEQPQETGEENGVDGAVIFLSGFAPLPEEYRELVLEQKGTLSEAVARMPVSLTAYLKGAEGETEAETEESGRVEVPVSWQCSQDYENTELDSYTFQPVVNAAGYALAEEMQERPVILVRIGMQETVPDTAVYVSEQTALQEAVNNGAEYVVLETDIVLNAALTVPSDASLILDGQGHSLLRGSGGDGQYEGVLLFLAGGPEAEEGQYADLTLKNCRINGQSDNGRSGAPAVITYGRLKLDSGAVVENNDNYGTYEGEVIPDYGGGIQVFRELEIAEGAMVTGNFADELGGGVYLADGAVLYLLADAVQGNFVGESDGFGSDIYACNGSTIYYAGSIVMDRENFYLCPNAILINLDQALMQLGDSDADIEIFLSISEGSGYSMDEVKAQLEQLGKRLGKNIRILTARQVIDTTDLRKWYVYDHYDTNPNCWDPLDQNGDGKPDAWAEVYGDNSKRKYYSYSEKMIHVPAHPVYTIKDWLDSAEYNAHSKLTAFKEHIYTRSQKGQPEMTFVGYGEKPNVDFLYYDPQSNGEKVVNFDVDSSQVRTHTLAGNGFLVNTSVNGNNLNGYLVYYTYAGDAVATRVSIRELRNINADNFHNGAFPVTSLPEVAGAVIPIGAWDMQMSIEIIAKPGSITVRQKPMAAEGDVSKTPPLLTYQITNPTGYSGFGPLVAYQSHACDMASSFTYSNLRMYFTNPKLEKNTLLNPFQDADFTQNTPEKETRKYFMNLVGDAQHEGVALDYNESSSFAHYQAYLELMQREGVGLITDKNTPFEAYLGPSGAENSNLQEVTGSSGKPTVQELMEQMQSYLEKNTTTAWNPDAFNPVLTPANSNVSAGNIWLADSTGAQIRDVIEEDMLDGGYQITIRDDQISSNNTGEAVKYSIQKPGSVEFEPLNVNGGSFEITANASDWPAGSYIVRQEIGNSPVYGHAGFEVERPSYRLYYDASGGSGAPVDNTLYKRGNTAALKFAPKPMKQGMQFWGWSRQKNAITPEFTENNNNKVTFGKSSITLYAVWIEEGFNVDGDVKEESGVPVKGATVKLIRANTVYGPPCQTDDTGHFSFTSIAPGIYNVVIEKGERIVTRFFEVVDQDVALGTITMPIGIINSRLQVAPDTPDIVVDGLDTLYLADPRAVEAEKGYTDADAQVVAGGGKAEFILTCTQKADETMTEEEKKAAEAIRQAAGADGRTVGLLIDFSLDKVITPLGGTPSSWQQTETVSNIGLHVFLPAQLQGKNDYTIYRYHNGVEELTGTPNERGESFLGIHETEMTADFEAGKFSLYAIAYRPETAADTEIHGSNSPSARQEPQPEQLTATEEIQPAVPQEVQPAVPQTGEPRTGDSRIPVMPVAAGAVTVFMIKIMLWMYELEFGITQEQKDAMIKELTDWARGTNRFRIYLAVGAMTAVLVWYHLSIRLKNNDKQMVKKEID